MSIENMFDDIHMSDELDLAAREYGLLSFKILLLDEIDRKIPYKLTEMKLELENKLKQLLYA